MIKLLIAISIFIGGTVLFSMATFSFFGFLNESIEWGLLSGIGFSFASYIWFRVAFWVRSDYFQEEFEDGFKDKEGLV